MLDDLLAKLKLKTHPPEDSVMLRVFTMLTVMTAIIAVLSREEWPSISIPVIVLGCAGFYVSYIRRRKNNILLKVVLSLAMLYALWDFINNLQMNPYDPRVSLANLLLWLQVIHSYDLPSRRDLDYSLMVGVTLIGVASVVGLDLSIIIFYAIFLVFGIIALFYNNLSRLNQDAEEKKEIKLSFTVRYVPAVVIFVLIFTGLIFLFIPRFNRLYLRPLPRSWLIRLPSITLGKVVNPGQESGESLRKKSGQDLKWNPDSYFGFNSYVNLNFRGDLSDNEVMQVQTNQWAYIRGLAFDIYDGTGWEVTGEKEQNFREITKSSPPIRPGLDYYVDQNYGRSVEVTQIYNITEEMPNIIFSVYDLELLFFPAETIYEDANGGLRSPYPLEKGMVYSSVSRYVPMTSEQVKKVEFFHKKLSRNGTRDPYELYYSGSPEFLAKYTQLPNDLPVRIKRLTAKVIRDRAGEYPSHLRAAIAVSSYLRETYPYDLEIPPFPDNADTVDYFLFDQKRGYCEHFASAMVVMLRTQGIPSRMIFGYLPGRYNAVTGAYSVRQSDAHAWVEVFIPSFGWYAFDPTPGFSESTFSATKNKRRWLFLAVLEWIKEKVPLDEIFRIAMIFLTVVVVLWVLWSLFLEIKARKSGKRNLQEAPLLFRLIWRAKEALQQVMSFSSPSLKLREKRSHYSIDIYLRMLKKLEKKGFSLGPCRTPREFLKILAPEFAAEAGFITSAYELARFGVPDNEIYDTQRINEAFEKLMEKVNVYKPEDAKRD